MNHPIPPNSLDAEQAVIGAMLTNTSAVDIALGALSADDFYRQRNGAYFDAIASLRAQGEPVDTLTVSSCLAKRSDIGDGWRAELATIAEFVPSAANVASYAATVKEDSILRSVIRKAQESQAAAYDREDSDGILNALDGFLVAVRAHETQDIVPLATLVSAAKERIADASIGKRHCGRPTYLTGLNSLIGGLEPGTCFILAARPSVGKAQPLSAKVLTPVGFIPMAAIRTGSAVVGGDGKVHRVASIHPQGKQPVYRIVTHDGETRATADHLWPTTTRLERRQGKSWTIKTTQEIADSIGRPDGTGYNHHIPRVAPVDLHDAGGYRPLHPYVLGVWLGDGCRGKGASISNPETDIADRVAAFLPATDQIIRRDDGLTLTIKRKQRNNQPSATASALRQLNLIGCHSYERFIPPAYIYTSVGNRIALVRGLIDTDGCVCSGGAIEYTTSSPLLASDVEFLCRSLGASVRTNVHGTSYTKDGGRVHCRLSYRMHIRFTNGIVPVTSAKHMALWRGNTSWSNAITDVVYDGEEECQCISLDGEEKTYVTDDFLVTHNTQLALTISSFVAVDVPVLFFSVEMSKEDIIDRLLSTTSQIGLSKLRCGELSDPEAKRMMDAAQSIAKLDLTVVDTATTIGDVEKITNRIAAKRKIGLVVVDYLQLLSLGQWSEGRVQEVSAMSRKLKLMARRHKLPALVLSQLNRPDNKYRSEDAREPEPTLASLRDSGAIEQDADIVAFLHRQYEKEPENVDLLVKKNRNGAIGTVKLHYDGPVLTFTEKG